jgi:hypothetical protein
VSARRHILVGLVWAVVGAAAAATAEVVELAEPPDAPWSSLRFRRIDRATTYTPAEIDGISAVRAESDCSASALRLSLDGIDLIRTPRLRWRWRVERALDIADEREKAGDDFAARVYVTFRFDPARASYRERALHRLGRLLYGAAPPGSAINFVWASRAAPGSTWSSPYTASSRIVALESGPGPGWREEDVDVFDLHATLFGYSPPPIEGIAIMSDSDDSCQRGAAAFADFRFEGPARESPEPPRTP